MEKNLIAYIKERSRDATHEVSRSSGDRIRELLKKDKKYMALDAERKDIRKREAELSRRMNKLWINHDNECARQCKADYDRIRKIEVKLTYYATKDNSLDIMEKLFDELALIGK